MGSTYGNDASIDGAISGSGKIEVESIHVYGSSIGLEVSGNAQIDGVVHTPVDSLTFAPSKAISTDASTGNIFTVTLTGSGISTLANPTNLKDGAVYRWIIKQDSSGGSDLLFGDDFIFNNGLPPSMMSASLGINILEGVSDGTNVYLLSNTALTSSAAGDPREILRTIGNDSVISYWYDASDSDHVTKDGSNLVATWADKSGNVRNATQATSGQKPTWTDNTIGGLPAIVFDGSNDILNLAGGADAPLDGDNVYIFIVAQTADGAGDANLFGVGSSATSYILSYGQGMALDEGKPLVKSMSATGVMIKGASSVASVDPFVLRGVLRDENSSLFVNGVVVGTDTSNDPNPHTAYTIAAIGGSNGSGGTGTDFFDGAIGEILCFTGSPLSDEEVRTIEKYLVYKWSLEGHYRS